jgi:hypothetical protein
VKRGFSQQVSELLGKGAEALLSLQVARVGAIDKHYEIASQHNDALAIFFGAHIEQMDFETRGRRGFLAGFLAFRRHMPSLALLINFEWEGLLPQPPMSSLSRTALLLASTWRSQVLMGDVFVALPRPRVSARDSRSIAVRSDEGSKHWIRRCPVIRLFRVN